jgi:rod shape-determining protein MreC
VTRGARSDLRGDTAVAVGCAIVALVLLLLPPARRDPIAGAIRGSVMAPAVALQGRIAGTRRAMADQRRLERLADSLAQRNQVLEESAAENAQLRAVLGLQARLAWGAIAAEALSHPAYGEEHTRVLSAGRDAGVESMSPVVAPDGVVGLVSAVDARSALAITWAHPDFRVSAMSADGNAMGIVSAHRAGGAGRWLMEMRGVPFRSVLAPGTRVVSSGMGGVFPRGIPVGTVQRVLEDEGGWVRTYLLTPAVRPTDVTAVLVLMRPRAAAGVDSVWRRP